MTDNPYNGTAADIAAAEGRMRQWPPLEDTEATVASVVRQIADAAATIVPTLRWVSAGERTQGSCPAPFASTAGMSVFLPDMYSTSPIPDAEWPAVLQVARDIASVHGLADIEVRADRPGDHNVRLHSGDGNEIRLGTARAALVSGRTGCRYLRADSGKSTE
ncbi:MULTISPECIES: LppA family lipoprotein [Rhodococcus]|uniref:LppA family lipoprotein n=1 Tax=Rhodococcus oxybenzonivorans TaxID=1990687 RepID=A0AAE4V2E2_9NOCA|nr:MULTISPECIES: LppA family lipoprotein [Rhodococcus]MDV7243069.1 LppA family lipoprotein [Rhodococcus oxybenzonivorans]MDV7267313.1 LppA family lipoprotein [Rhodococcus oxybenzonivorans]MDV7275473.1 LppA family lipoprotein [Rhodococcus oxybenzonivorans]MDV7334672.1 LppA family lipoprotein [Rhodococcus oxybenzonivorans]MDV7344826.1 LppA family lipoprotein [Rhodococcus oxybenzonivorans]